MVACTYSDSDEYCDNYANPNLIVNVVKVAEYVEIQNLTQASVNLRVWKLISEAGNESCGLRGMHRWQDKSSCHDNHARAGFRM